MPWGGGEQSLHHACPQHDMFVKKLWVRDTIRTPGQFQSLPVPLGSWHSFPLETHQNLSLCIFQRLFNIQTDFEWARRKKNRTEQLEHFYQS